MGLPLREEFRRHNKRIDGYLEFESFQLIHSGAFASGVDVSHEHEIKMVSVEQWVDGESHELWPSTIKPKTLAPSSQMEFSMPLSGLLLRNMDAAADFNQPEFSKHAVTSEFVLGPSMALWGRSGAGMVLKNEDPSQARDLGVTLSFHQGKRSGHEPLPEHSSTLLARASHKGTVSLQVRDAKRDNYRSRPEKLSSMRRKTGANKTAAR